MWFQYSLIRESVFLRELLNGCIIEKVWHPLAKALCEGKRALYKKYENSIATYNSSYAVFGDAFFTVI